MPQETKEEKAARVEKRKQEKANRKLNKQAVTVGDGTEVLKSKDSRQKVRRYTFEADVQLFRPGKQNEAGEEVSPFYIPMRTLKLEAVSYCNAKQVKDDCKVHESYLRSQPLFRQAQITVRAIPRETVSPETLRQLEGYRDMSVILDKALEMAIEEAADVVLGKAVGLQFVEKPSVEAVGDTPASPAITKRDLKEAFYKKALETLKPKRLVNEPEQVAAGNEKEPLASETVRTEPFQPEIIEIQKAKDKQEDITLCENSSL